jgi:hypothetical protein
MTLTRRLLFGLMAFLAVGVALVSYRYLLPGMPGGSDFIIANRYARAGFLVAHAGFAATALLIGWAQFLGGVRRRWPAAHRWTGRVYASAVLCGGAAGLVLALGATTGMVSTMGFGALAVVWVGCTAQGWRYAWARDFAEHRRWMIRSFALTLAAVTLRIYLPLSGALGLNMILSYRAISFLCWVPNLMIAEVLLATRWRTTPAMRASLAGG